VRWRFAFSSTPVPSQLSVELDGEKRENVKNEDRISKLKEDGLFLRGIRVREYATSL
jgi:hypothetical protein